MKTKLMNTTVIRAPVALLVSAGLLLLVAGTQGSDPGRGLERDNAGGGKLGRNPHGPGEDRQLESHQPHLCFTL